MKFSGPKLVGVLALLGAAVLVSGCPWLLGKKESKGTAPDFSLTTFGGEAKSLAAYRGQPLVLNFWAVW